jgi:hypothetical protein
LKDTFKGERSQESRREGDQTLGVELLREVVLSGDAGPKGPVERRAFSSGHAEGRKRKKTRKLLVGIGLERDGKPSEAVEEESRR